MTAVHRHLNTKKSFLNHPQQHHSFMLEKVAELKEEYQHFQKSRKKRKYDLSKPVATWTEQDVLDGGGAGGEVVDAFVIILRSLGCRWHNISGCTMCGYFADTYPVNVEQVRGQISNAHDRYQNQPVVKLFSSGSFFDEADLPLEARSFFLESFGGKAKKLIVESRPDIITEEALSIFEKAKSEVEVALGLETSNDHLLTYSINKGFTFKDYVKAATLIREKGMKVKTYLLLKPPYLTEHEAINDAVLSVRDALPYSDTISINPVNIQNFTFLRYLWREKLYRAPWLWSLLEVLKQCHEQASGHGVRLMSSPSGAGTERGVHNCGKCDGKVKTAVEEYSLGGDVAVFEELICGCRELWRDGVEAEAIVGDEVLRA